MRFLALSILAATPLAAADAPLRALLVCGGCCHDYEIQSGLLRDGIQARANVQVDVMRSEDSSTRPWFPIYEDKDWAKGYDVVIHDECAADVKTMPYVQHIIDAHKNGVAAVNLHCAMHSYRTGDERWFEFLGLQSTGHGWQKPIEIDFSVNEHPVTKGMTNWATNDEELYNNVKVYSTATPLALGNQIQSDGKKDSAVVTWTNDFHGTRIFNTTIGHNNSTVGDARYLDLVTRGLLWSCDKLNAIYLKPYTGPKGRTTLVPPKSEMRGEAPANATMITATASSVQPENWVWKAADGTPDTRWCAEGPAFPQWYQLEFEKPRKITGLKIIWEAADNAYSHTIEGSLDGKQWTVLSDAKQNSKLGDTSAEFVQTEVKFLKVTCTGTSKGGWACIREIAATGEGIGPLFAGIPNAEKNKIADPFQKRGNTIPKILKLTPEEEAAILKDVKVAEGFDVSLFSTASAANYPVYVAASPSGDLYVASDGNGSLGRDPNRGRIIRLRDTDKDGRADQATEFVKDLDSPRGMVWDHDRLYVIHPPDVSVFIDHDRDGQADEQKTLITGIAFGYKDRTADHTTNGLSLGIDGWLYIAAGDFGFMEATGTDGKKVQHRSGGVLRFRPDGSGLEIFSTGARNILGTPISPLLDLFARDNTNDGGGWDVRLHHFTGLEDHGYPRMYMNFSDEIVKPLADYGGGSGCGSVYISEPGIPKAWNDAPFTCDWGSGALWKHSVEARGATFAETAKPEPLVQVTRPTDADIDGMSAIYQASWKGATFIWEGPNVGYIVRVTPKGYTPEPLPDFDHASDAELIKLLESPSQVRAMEAQRALNRRPSNTAMEQGLVALAENHSKPLTSRVAAVFALADCGIKAAAAGPAIDLLTPLATDPQLQRFVLRALGDMGLDQLAAGKSSAPAAVFATGLKSADPRTRLEAIVGATRQNLKVLAADITTQLGDADPVLAHTAFRSLAILGATEACFAVVDHAEAPSAQRTGALRALMRMHQPAVVDGLLERLDKPAQASKRNGLLGALCRLHFHEGTWLGDSWGTRPDTRGPYYQPEAWSETPKIAATLKAALAKATPNEAAFLAREMKRNRIESNDALDRLLALAKDNAELAPDVIAQLAGADSIPAPAIPIIFKAVRTDGPPDLLARAIAILAKVNSAESCEVSLAVLAKLPAGKERDLARQAFLAAPKLENHHLMLEKMAEKLDGSTATWADAALLALSARKEGSPESRELSQKAIDKGWQTAKRQNQIMQAIRLTDFHGLDDKVRLATTDTDSSISNEAAETAKHLKLEKLVEDKTVLVSTLKPEEVVAEVLKTTGDESLGQQLFIRQACTICHAASMDEPQKGPYLGSIAQTYSRADLALNIIDPGKTIAQGFATEMFTLKAGSAQMGFVTFESAAEVKIRNITAQEFTYKTTDIAKREKLPNSLMPPGLVNGLTLREFASMLDYLESLSKK